MVLAGLRTSFSAICQPSFFEGKQVIPLEEHVQKLRAAQDARRDPDFVIIARTDALAVTGWEDVQQLAQGAHPAPRPPGIAEPEASPEAPRWSWARLLTRVFARAMARGPWGPQGPLRIIAALTPGAGGWTLLRPLKRAAAPPPLAPARVHPAACAWTAAGARLGWRGPRPARWLGGATPFWGRFLKNDGSTSSQS